MFIKTPDCFIPGNWKNFGNIFASPKFRIFRIAFVGKMRKIEKTSFLKEIAYFLKRDKMHTFFSREIPHCICFHQNFK